MSGDGGTPEPGPVLPGRRKVFDGTTLRRLAAEFVIIVVGVLVAFAVEDWRAERDRIQAANRLLDIMESEITASVEDLREAASSARVRHSALGELARLAGDPLPEDADVVPWAEAPFDQLRGAALRRQFEPTWETLILIPAFVQVFDPRLTAFDEFRSTGALSTIPDVEIQQEIVDFYGSMLDFEESNAFHRSEQTEFRQALYTAGLTLGDWLPRDEFLTRLRASPEARAALRRNFLRAGEQANSYLLVADLFEEDGEEMIARARAVLSGPVRPRPGR